MFLFLAMERVVYGWDRGSNRWALLKDKQELDKEHVREMQELLFGRGALCDQWLSDPDAMTEKAVNETLGRDPDHKSEPED